MPPKSKSTPTTPAGLKQATLSSYFARRPPAAATPATPAPTAATSDPAPSSSANVSPSPAPPAATPTAAPPAAAPARKRARARSDRANEADTDAARRSKRARFVAQLKDGDDDGNGSDYDPGAAVGDDDDDDDVVVIDGDDDEEEASPVKAKRARAASKGGASRSRSTPAAVPAAASSRKGSSKGKRRTAAADQVKYTPLEKQVVELKEQYPDVLLAVEVGYKYRFFGDDAKIAAEHLHIVCWQDKNFLTASIPTHRVGIHMRRLVRAGYKVGLVQQTETAALKSVSGNARGPFSRQLTRLYTPATLIDDLDDDDEGAGGAAHYLAVFHERIVSGRRVTAVVAVDPATADIVYDEFVDGELRAELEWRLVAVDPVELVVAGVTDETRAWLTRFATMARHPVRIEDAAEVPDGTPIVAELVDALQGLPEMIDQVLNSTAAVQHCLYALHCYLQQFDLDSLFRVAVRMHHFSSIHTFHLSAATARHLGLFPDPSDARAPSLYKLLNHTHFPVAARLLRSWLARPLLDQRAITRRQDAVARFVESITAPEVKDFGKHLKRLGDAEKWLLRTHYGRIKPAALWSFLQTWVDVTAAVVHAGEIVGDGVAEVVAVKGMVEGFLASMDRAVAMQDDVANLWVEDELAETREELAQCVRDLTAEAKAEAATVSGTVVAVSGIEFMIQVPKSRKVPASWHQVSATKQVTRFHPPRIVELIKRRDILAETLQSRSKEVYRARLRAFSTAVFADMSRAIQRVAEMDCLLSLATVAVSQLGYSRPEIVDAQVIKLVDARHPVVETVVDQYVPNSVELDQTGLRCMLLSGPNMGGKTSVVRMIALNVLLAQIGSYVPCTSATVGVFDGIFTRMGAADDLVRGHSTLMVELLETQSILSRATPRSLVILDELGRGTATHDGTAIAYAVLHHMVRDVRACTLFVTHFPALKVVADRDPRHVRAAHMGFVRGEGEHEVTFLYKLADGLADRSYGLNVARLAGVPEAVLAVAAEKSREMEARMTEGVERRVVESDEGELAALAEEIRRVVTF
ncbi:Mismatch repair protein msh3 [Allomyces javanicus]|nr:Mismatch repair protein msh3 [Allomyces javanicus]